MSEQTVAASSNNLARLAGLVPYENKPFSIDHQEYRGLTFLCDPERLPDGYKISWDYETGTLNCQNAELFSRIYFGVIGNAVWRDAATLLRMFGEKNRWAWVPHRLITPTEAELAAMKTSGSIN